MDLIAGSLRRPVYGRRVHAKDARLEVKVKWRGRLVKI
jgi:hypothetical protein